MNDTQPKVEFPKVVDNTIMTTFDACEIKSFYNFLLHLVPKGTSADLHAGGAFAAGMERIRHALWIEDLSLDEALVEGMRTFTEFWGDFITPETNPKSYERVLMALVDYFRVYPPETDHIRPYIMKDGKPAIEFTFAYPTRVLHPMTNEPILYGGRFDLLGYHGSMLCIIDEKTTKALGPSWERQWQLRGQFIGYCWAAQQYGLKVNNAMIRGVGILKTKITHLEAFQQYDNWQIDRWFSQLNRKLEKMVERWKYDDWGFSYGDACASYGGCQYLPLCTSKDPRIWFDDYLIKQWNPLNKDPITEKEAA